MMYYRPNGGDTDKFNFSIVMLINNDHRKREYRPKWVNKVINMQCNNNRCLKRVDALVTWYIVLVMLV